MPVAIRTHALPEALPRGEYLLWQGKPTLTSTALHVFHVRKVAIYFAALMAWRLEARLYDGATLTDAAIYAVWLAPIAAAGLALLVVLAWLTARSTIYTVTSKRVVLRIGIALSMTVNLPYKAIEAAGLKLFADGSGDIALTPTAGGKLGYAVLWPHVRRWRFSRPQPTLRSIPNARHVADLLSEALANQQMAVAAHEDTSQRIDRPAVAYHTAAE
jgi:hypothetical protein